MEISKNHCACTTETETDSGVNCRSCGVDALPYWCETCKQLVADKRCPTCGLKCIKVRHHETP